MKKARVVTIPEDRPLTPEEYEDLRTHAVNSSVWYATTYNRSEQQLREKLYAKGYPKEPIPAVDILGEVREVDLVEEVLDHLRQDAYVIDDTRLARHAIERAFASGEGPSKVRMSLLRRGIDRETIDELLDELGESDAKDAALEKAAERVLASSAYRRIEEPWKRKQKLVTVLTSKGFGFGDINDWWEGYSQEED